MLYSWSPDPDRTSLSHLAVELLPVPTPLPAPVTPSHPVQISKANHLRSQNWGSHELALAALLEWISKLRAGNKADGEVWAPAALIGRRRAANQVLHTDLIVFDSDAGHTLAEITARFTEIGWYARIIPSSSWGKDETEASADHFDAWVAAQILSGDDLAERYLVEQLHKTPAVAKGAVELNRVLIETRNDQGHKQAKHVVRFKHGPCEKYRIVCVLSARFDLSTAQARRTWKSLYDAAIDRIDLPFDRSTGSPERLFYLSYLSTDRLKPARDHQVEIQGGQIDLSALPPPKVRERTQRQRGPRTFKEDQVQGRGGDDEPVDYLWDGIDLRVFAAKGGLATLELASVLADNGWPQDDRGVVDGKHHIECPFAEQHSNTAGGGTFAWNASEHALTGLTDLQPRAGIVCNHNACQGRDPLEMLTELLRKGGLTTADLQAAGGAAKQKSLREDFPTPIEPEDAVLKPLVVPSMDWTADQIYAHASALRRLKRWEPEVYEEAKAGWVLLGLVEEPELDLAIEVAPDETDDDGPASPTPADRRWRTKLRCGKDGLPLATAGNIAMALEHGLGLTGDVVAFNQLKSRVEIRDPRRVPWCRLGEAPRPWNDNDDTEAAVLLEHQLGDQSIRPHIVTPIVEMLGRRHAYHPVRDYLTAQVWDQVPRLDTLLIDHGGAADNPFVRAATARTLIAAVARIMKPGCKVDTALILESRIQGFRKSTLFSALAVDAAWFTDSPGHLGEQACIEIITAHWFVELAELSTLKKADIDATKAFLSRQYDKYRPAYHRRVADFPRQCIVVGSVNPDNNGYLRDLTGNRRFWSVTVGALDLDAIIQCRDQIWAEAKARFDAGERWHFDDATEAHLIEAQAEEAEERVSEPEIVETMRRFLSHRPGVSGHDRDMSEAWTPRPQPVTVIPSMSSYFNAIGKPTRDIRFNDKVAFNQATQALHWEVRQAGVRGTNPIGLPCGARFYVSPEGVEAAHEGRLHEWLVEQVRLGAVAGMEKLADWDKADVIVLEEKRKPGAGPKPKKPKTDGGL
jgi:predicted P-loop ATPase